MKYALLGFVKNKKKFFVLLFAVLMYMLENTGANRHHEVKMLTDNG